MGLGDNSNGGGASAGSGGGGSNNLLETQGGSGEALVSKSLGAAPAGGGSLGAGMKKGGARNGGGAMTLPAGELNMEMLRRTRPQKPKPAGQPGEAWGTPGKMKGMGAMSPANKGGGSSSSNNNNGQLIKARRGVRIVSAENSYSYR